MAGDLSGRSSAGSDAPGPDGDGIDLGRRRFAACGCAALLSGLLAAPAGAAWLSTGCRTGLPPAALALLLSCLAGLDPAELWDTHCHLLGNGDAGSGCRLHPSLVSGHDVLERLRHRAILDAACVPAGAPSVDRAYVERLVALAADYPPGARWMLFAFEQAYDGQGRPDPAHTTLHVPDAYAAQVAAAHPGRFAWVASIHPYREDARDALARAVAEGAVAVKWLPSAMNIDLRDARSGRFAEGAAALGLPVIVHCGEEKAVPGARRDDLVNPLHARALLERGATVVVAHCASLGHALDLDRRSAPEVPAFDLFARLMDERVHGDRLLGDLSAVFQINRSGTVWQTLLQRQDWHARLLHGSDYPLPGLKPLVSLWRLRAAGLLAADDEAALAELRAHNPLAFDFALKRRLRLGSARLADAVFATRSRFPRALVRQA